MNYNKPTEWSVFKTAEWLLDSQIENISNVNKSKIERLLTLPKNLIEKSVSMIYLKSLLFSTPKVDNKKIVNSLIKEINQEDSISDEIDDYIEKSRSPFIFNKKVLDNISDSNLEKQIELYDWLVKEYEEADSSKKAEIRNERPLPTFESFPDKIQKWLSHKLNINNSLFHSHWAENNNYWRVNSDVYKHTMDRHDKDYFSVLQLIKFMIALESDYRAENKRLEKHNVEIKIANDAFIFYTDSEWNYKRLIKQDFAWGKTIDVALKEELYTMQVQENNPTKYKKQIDINDVLDDIEPEDFLTHIDSTWSELFIAYKEFLKSTANISNKKWYLLDISDSRQWWATRRWNILNTSNVFVKKNNWKYIFTIIDPDVFNKDWRAKFDWNEITETIINQIKNPTILNRINAYTTWLKTQIVNLARDWIQNDNKNLNSNWIYTYLKRIWMIPSIAVAEKQLDYMKKILWNTYFDQK